MDGDEIDEDALEDWRPPALGEVMACALAPFAPKLALDQPIVEAGADALRPAQRIAPRDPHGGKDSMRIARVGWRSGAPMLVRHDCSDDDTCQEICLCPSGVAYDEDLFDDCRKSWVKRRKTNDGRLLCRDGDNAGALVIHRNGGLIEFRGLGGPSVAEIN